MEEPRLLAAGMAAVAAAAVVTVLERKEQEMRQPRQQATEMRPSGGARQRGWMDSAFKWAVAVVAMAAAVTTALLGGEAVDCVLVDLEEDVLQRGARGAVPGGHRGGDARRSEWRLGGGGARGGARGGALGSADRGQRRVE